MALAAFGIPPMKAVTGELPPDDDPRWAYEIKWDGYRALAFVDGGRVRFQSTRSQDLTARWPELGRLPGAVHAPSAILDGEVVALDEAGVPRFSLLHGHAVAVTYVVFDVLSIGGVDTTGLSYRERRRLLEQLVDPGPHWIVTPSQVGDGAHLADAAEALGLEGVMAKRLDGTYRPGRRSPDWRKVKRRHVQEFVVGGWLPGTGSRAASFGALLVGVFDRVSDGGRLRYCGAVGSGFTDRALADWRDALVEAALVNCPFDPAPPAEVASVAQWCRPVLVAQVAFAEWTPDGVLRHPVHLGRRDDVDPHAVARER